MKGRKRIVRGDRNSLLEAAVDGCRGRRAVDLQIGGGCAVDVFNLQLPATAGGVGQQNSVSVRVDRCRDSDLPRVDLFDHVADRDLVRIDADRRENAFGISDLDASLCNALAAVVIIEQCILAYILPVKIGALDDCRARVERATQSEGGRGCVGAADDQIAAAAAVGDLYSVARFLQ